MAQKVVTAHKMKSRQETTSLGQIATVAAKPTISDNKHLQTPTQEVLKFRRATWDPSPPPPAGPLYQFNSVLGNTLSTIHSCIVVWVLFCVFTVFGIKVEPPLTATSLQSIHSLLFQPLYNGHFFLSPRWPL